ncbi:condensin complex subunit 1 [Phymastichus coffea]|uniref:condensin complex subunit 1 n=1 Tax=Phymastichus coffea TaxID=108790 RepID=UPI00273BE6E2|nr:condensin complex subunit 1 [Phymastichus coffea]
MINQDFVIPLDKDELVRTHFTDYGHRDIVPLQMINKEINAINQQKLTEKGPFELVQEKLDLFLSVIVHGNKLELSILLRVFNRILKIVQNIIGYLEKKAEQSPELDCEQNEKLNLLSTIKILAYIKSSTLCLIEDQIADNNSNNADNIGKRKKNIQKSDIEEEWEIQREQAMEILHRWLQLPLKNLWTPPIVEDTFVSTIGQICYKILEKTKDIKSKTVRNLIFQILGILVKKYNHGIACVVRIIQLAKFHEALAVPIGVGVVTMITECGCSGLIKEIAREIGESEPGEADARNFCNFLEAVATTQADIMLPILDNIMDFLDKDCYVMRNCAIGVMGVIVAKVLTGEELPPEKRIIRDECLDNLEEHILDSNAYVRSKVLQTWQRLCCDGAIPLSRQNSLLKASVLRLEDKSANVRKQALQLLRAILQSNPFASKMNQEKFAQNLEQAKTELKQLQTEIYHTAEAEEEKEELWKTQLPLIESAIDQLTEEERNNPSDDEVENEELEEINMKETFDKIQNYILKDKCRKAVKYLKKLFKHSGFAKEMKNLSEETKKEALLLFMYKIFMNSTSKKNDTNNDEKATQSTKKRLTTDQEEINKLDQIKVKKKLVEYLQNCLDFSTELEKTIPTVEKLLYSVNPGDAIEACSFLGAAKQFQIAGALDGVRKALFQIFCRDQSVRDNLAMVYKEIYLDHSGQLLTSRAKALRSVYALIQLLDGMLPGQSAALSKLVVSWRGTNELDGEALKVMWEMFSLKLNDTTSEQSRSALMLLTMAAQVEPNIITDNLDVLIKVGLGERAQIDLLLARDTCRAFLSIKQDCSKDIDKSPIKYPNDHEIFIQLSSLMKEKIFEEKENGYTSFATDAINVIYHLADQPANILQDILAHIGKTGNFIRTSGAPESNIELPSHLLSRFLYVIGHTAIRELVLLDQSIYKELKRRNAVREKKKEVRSRISNIKNRKSSSNTSRISNMSTISNASTIMGSAHRSIRAKHDDEQEDSMEGSTADDADAEHINMCLEEELLAENGYLRKFLPLILEVCQHPEKYSHKEVQAYGVIALGKFMTISSNFCEKNLQLFVTILERSSCPQIRANILIGLADLMTRFPNQVEPWTSHIYGRLKDDNLTVRSTCVRMLSNLILGEMIRVKGQVAQLALCLVDDNEIIRSDTKQLFKDLSHKGHALYNVMPDILSCLSDSELKLSEKNFQEIIKYILGLLQKDRQVDSIIEKLCSRFKLATSERQWRDLSYCLSLLKFSAKGIKILTKDLPLLKEKIHNDDVQKALNSIIDQAKRRPDAKVACAELEEKIKELLDNTDNNEQNGGSSKPLTDSEAMPPPLRPVPKTSKATRKTRGRREEEEEDEDENDEDFENRSTSKNNSIRRSSRKKKSDSINNATMNSESEDEENKTPRKSTRITAVKTPTPIESSILVRKNSRKKNDSISISPSPVPPAKRIKSSRT